MTHWTEFDFEYDGQEEVEIECPFCGYEYTVYSDEPDECPSCGM
jgi:rubrerythrin